MVEDPLFLQSFIAQRLFSSADIVGDALCTIELSLRPGETMGHASPKNIGEGASAIIRGCVGPQRMGGTANEIGEPGKKIKEKPRSS